MILALTISVFAQSVPFLIFILNEKLSEKQTC